MKKVVPCKQDGVLDAKILGYGSLYERHDVLSRGGVGRMFAIIYDTISCL